MPGNHRLDLREREFRNIAIGDSVDVIYAGNDRFNVYRRGGVFTEPGNFVSDGVLLTLEGLLVWFGARRVGRALKAIRVES